MSIQKWSRKKPIAKLLAESGDEKVFRPSLSLFHLFMLGIGAVVGAGIFVLIGIVASQHAGPGVMLSILLAPLCCALAGLCYAELSSALPSAGGAYTFIYASLGELPAWFMGCLLLLTYIVAAAAVSNGSSAYLVSFLADRGLTLPLYLTHSFGEVLKLSDGTEIVGLVNLPAILIVSLLSLLVYRGAAASALANTAIVIIKMAVLVGFVLIGVQYVDTANWQPSIPHNTGVFGEFGWSGVLMGASMMIFGYGGFDVIAAAAQDAKNPKSTVPVAMLSALAVTALLYVAIAAVLTGIISYDKLNVAQPMALAVDVLNIKWFGVVLKIGAIAGLTSVAIAVMFASVRILYMMSQDGLLPQRFSHSSDNSSSCKASTIAIWAIISFLTGVVPLEHLLKLTNVGIISTFAMVCYATVVLRRIAPDLERKFLCPLYPFIPYLGVLVFTIMLLNLFIEMPIHIGLYIIASGMVYILYGRHHSMIS
jgi:APA family basic amino acid/polyamine antiporter